MAYNPRYHVKWTDQDGETCYGLYRDPALGGLVAAFGRLPAEGQAFVEDAISPVTHEVPEDALVDIPTSPYPDELSRYVQECLERAVRRSDRAKGLVGKLFSIPVADGRAWYVVVKENKKTVRIEWRGYCLDRWTDHHFGYGGLFDREEVLQHVRRREATLRLFSSV